MRILLFALPVGDGWNAGTVGAERRAGMSRAPGEWLTIEQVMARYGIDRSTINKAIRNGRIEVINDGGRRWVMGWKAAELWEYRTLEAEGLRRCVECLEVKAIEAFAFGRPEHRRRTCRECWRPIAAREMDRYRKRPAVKRRIAEWYAERGGVAVYNKTGRMRRRINILQDERG